MHDIMGKAVPLQEDCSKYFNDTIEGEKNYLQCIKSAKIIQTIGWPESVVKNRLYSVLVQW